MQRFTLLVIFSCLVLNLNAQNAKIDSLRFLISQDKDDTNKVIHYLKLSYQFSRIRNLDSVASTANSAFQLSKRLNFTKGIAWSCNNLGGVNQERENYTIAIGYLRTAIEAKLDLRDTIGLGSSYTNLGLCYLYMNILDSSLFYTKKSIELKELKHDTTNLILSYNNMGLYYMEIEDYKNALIFFEKSLDMCLSLLNRVPDITFELGSVYSNIGTAYYHLGLNTLAIENYNKSMEYSKDVDSVAGKYRYLNNMGNIYADKSDEERLNGDTAAAERDYQAAIKNYLESIELKKGEDDGLAILQSYLNLADLSRTSGHLDQAAMYGDTLVKLALKEKNLTGIKNSYLIQSRIYSDRHNYSQAQSYLNLYYLYAAKDSINTPDNIYLKENLRRNSFSDSDVQVYTNRLSLLTAQSLLIKKLLWSLGILIALGLLFFVGLRLRNKRLEKNWPALYSTFYELVHKGTVFDNIHFERELWDLIRDVNPDLLEYDAFIDKREREGRTTEPKFFIYDVLAPLKATTRRRIIKQFLFSEKDPNKMSVYESLERLAKEKSRITKLGSEVKIVPGQPTVFISYSWGESEHENWVQNLAQRMKSDGINVILDKIHFKNGDNNLFFVEKAILDSDNVILIFSPSYLLKTHDLKTGVGLEFHMITSAFISENSFPKKLIYVLRSGLPEESIPLIFRQTFLCDMRNDIDYEIRYQELIRLILSTLHDEAPSKNN